MGALHAGHLSLVEKAREKASKTVASIFVNPTQFAPGEDFDTYPRDSEKDIAKLASVGCDLVYLPSVEEMYPPGNTTNVRVEGMSDLLDGVYRPHFFYGVATVVARLFLHVQPDVAVFGEKDYQQLQIIRRMVRDLGFPVDILGGATTRDADGLSIGVAPSVALDEARTLVMASGFRKLDYVSLVDPDTLIDLPDAPLAPGTIARLLGAAWMGKTRLIDNISATR